MSTVNRRIQLGMDIYGRNRTYLCLSYDLKYSQMKIDIRLKFSFYIRLTLLHIRCKYCNKLASNINVQN